MNRLARLELALAIVASFGMLGVGLARGYFIAYPLLAVLLLFMLLLLRRGVRFQELLHLGWLGIGKAAPVLVILLLIGAVTSSWMAAGTVPALVYYGVQLIQPQFFVLAAFLLTSGVSLLLGTSFGTVSTIGLALMLMAKGSQQDPHLIAGAIIAGAYFGDRCSPMSSSANLIASITQTQLYTNIKNMVVSALLPLAVACLIYLGLSLLHPVQLSDRSLLLELRRLFDLNPLVLLPALTILLLAIVRIDIRLSMLLSIAMAAGIALLVQHQPLLELLRSMLLGFHLSKPSPLEAILKDGGVMAMGRVAIVVIISTAFAGILAGTQVLGAIESWLVGASRSRLFLGTAIVGTAAAAFGCTQTIAILLTQQLVEKKYEAGLNSYELALDLENTVVVISPLIPWNIAGLVPATVLMTDSGYVPFAVYLYLIPLLGWFQQKRREALS